MPGTGSRPSTGRRRAGRGEERMGALDGKVVVDSGLNGTRILLERALGAPPAG